MEISLSAVFIIMGVLFLIDLFILLATILTKVRSRKNFGIRNKLKREISRAISSGHLLDLGVLPKEREPFLILWHQTASSLAISQELHTQLLDLTDQWEMETSISRLLKSFRWNRRIRGLMLLDFLQAPKKIELLQWFLRKEKTVLLRIKAVDMLCRDDFSGSMDRILESMNGAEEVYRQKVLRILSRNAEVLQDWVENHKGSLDHNVLHILVQASKFKRKDWYLPFLMRMIYSEHKDIREEAAEILFQRYESELDLPQLMEAGYPLIRQKAVQVMIRSSQVPGEEETSSWLSDKDLYRHVVRAFQEKLKEDPRFVPEVFERYKNAEKEEVRLGYAEILTTKMPYFISQLESGSDKKIRKLIDDAITLHISSDLIDFLNKNKSERLETQMMRILRPYLQKDSYFLQQCQMYLNEKIRLRWFIPEPSRYEGSPKIQLTEQDRGYMTGLMLLVSFIPVLLYGIFRWREIPYMTGEEILVTFLFHFHYLFAFYTIAVNTIYLILMILSWYAFNQQHSEWLIADKQFLFTPGILPSVTILAPAYNEEKTIIQNVYSLLSLEYPDLELVIINDGSSDRTASRLIDHFKLELEDYPSSEKIVTAPVSGVYRNKRIPQLILIDKKNGGKADSLNAGLNLASGEYICSIDADSLLEPEALTKLIFRTLTNKKKTIAVGGNIIPVNGSKVDNGYIEEIHLPGNRLAKYQTIEYLRSFIAGRLGWSKLNSLLIISGAFGAFNREYVQNVGGYMTGRGSMKKDTVGEDMELVVRLIRFLSERKLPFKVDYAHNANCWTEVPEDLESLLKQRDRWHRGLIEIMVYHKKMLLNKKYGTAGLVSFPYFYLFELLGPFWEAQGYVVLLLSFFLGLLSSKVFLFMFVIVVLYGVLISSTALFLAEKQVIYFKGREFLSGIGLTFLENFGYRQFMSVIRPFCYISYLFRNKDWQKLERRGFQQETHAEETTDEK